MISSRHKARVLVAGDVMVDKFIDVEITDRAEENAPVVRMATTLVVPGGAGRVALNVAALGASGALTGVVGDDADGQWLRNKALPSVISTRGLMVDSERCTTAKTRIRGPAAALLRLDQEHTQLISPDLEQRLRPLLEGQIDWAGAVVLSDYAKGALPRSLVEFAISRARARGRPVVVDPKGSDFGRYRGCTAITPNAEEACRAIGMTHHGNDHHSVLVAGARLSVELPGTFVIVTRGSLGMAVFCDGAQHQTIPAVPAQERSAIGAGDAVIAAMAVALAAGLSMQQAMELGNRAGGVAVTKGWSEHCTINDLVPSPAE